MKALVVEGSSTMRSVLRRILSMRGFEVAEADSARLALDVVNSTGKADLVLLDWSLREVDCKEFITRLRDEAAHFTFVIMLAAPETDIREFQKALIAGADACLVKPFTSLQIDEKLAQAALTWGRG